jgi:hypothetical protein
VSVDRAFVRLALACLAVGVLSSMWEFLALQPPSSPWHLGGFPVATARLTEHALATGLVTLALAPADGRARRALFAIAALGAALALAADALTAATAWRGVVIHDARGGSLALLVASLLGGALQLTAFAWGLRLRWTAPPPAPAA